MSQLKYILIAFGVFAVDMSMKNTAEAWVNLHEREEGEPPESKIFVPRKLHNRGFAMNVADKHPGKVAKLSLISTILMAIAFILSLKGDRPLRKLSYALQLGGACSNTHDRLYRGYVVDYLSFKTKGKLGKIAFNIADMALLFGPLLALVDSIMKVGEKVDELTDSVGQPPSDENKYDYEYEYLNI